MEESGSDIDLEFGYVSATASPPSRVLFAAPFPSSSLLSICHALPRLPIEKTSAYVSLCGRLVHAEEATSWRTVGGLKGDAAVAWELMTPIQRVVLVATIGVAVALSKKDGVIKRLMDSVHLRDRVLSDMQQKLDDLCEQLNSVKEQERLGSGVEGVPGKNKGFPFDPSFESKGISFVDCGCWLCNRHHDQFNGFGSDFGTRASNGAEMLFAKMGFNEGEPEERRLSDLSDLASSVTSIMETSDIQMNAFATEQDMYNLKKECEQKDATISELTGMLRSSDAAASKRIAELEDLVRRKNMIVTKLKKDMVILEQKVVHFTRLQRTSSSRVVTKPANTPVMTDNLLYDMESTSPSSSDSDSSPGSKSQVLATKVKEILMENPTNDDKVIKVSLKQKLAMSVAGESTPFGDPRRGRKPSLPEHMDSSTRKRSY